MLLRCSHLMARVFLGAVMTRTPSEERLEATSSCLVLGGRVYFLLNILDTILLPSSAFSSCFPSTARTPSLTLTLSSSGLYWLVSRLTSSLFSSSLTRITSVSLLLKMSVWLERSVFSAGSIQRRGNIQPFSHLDLESCLISDLGADVCSSEVMAPLAGDSSMMLDMQAMLRKSSSNFFHMSLDSVNMASLTLSKSSQEFLKKGSSKKKSLMVTGTLDPDIFMFFARLIWDLCFKCVLKVCLPFTPM